MIQPKKIIHHTCVLAMSAFALQQALAETPAPIEPPIIPQTIPATSPGVQPPIDPPVTDTTTTSISTTTSVSRAVNEFQGDEIGVVLRTLARQAKINIAVSDKVVGTVTMRLENMGPLDAIKTIVEDKSLFLTEKNGVYYVKSADEKAKEPTESGHFVFSYAQAKDVLPLLKEQLQSKEPPQFDARTNTIFYREARSNLDKIALFLEAIDKPTQQVMIEARLVEVTANPKQAYGINWGGVLGSSSTPQTLKYGGSNNTGFTSTSSGTNGNPASPPTGSGVTSSTNANTLTTGNNLFGTAGNFLLGGNSANFLNALGGQFAILSVPQMSATLRLLNEDSDAEFLANPRVVTANNLKATIKIIRNQPVPQLNFNEQTATAVFGGFEDKEFGNTLIVTPSINKDDFVTMLVQPEISNKVADAAFTFAGATVTSPIIDKRSLESNVLIKSGDTLAIGGLLQDEMIKSRTKVPFLGDLPIIGYAFQERINTRTKRNLLVFVTPTIIKQGYGTGLEDQVSGLHHSGEEYADPNGWRNNAKGTVRLLPTSQRQIAADYPKPGMPASPETVARYKVNAVSREK